MKRAAPAQQSHPVRLLLHCEDGTIPYMTPLLLQKYVPPSDDFWIGLAVRDTCVVPTYKQKKANDSKTPNTSNKPNGYSFGFKGLDSFLAQYNRVTVPSFDVLQDAADNDSRKEPAGVSATNGYVQVWTPHGRHKLTSSLFSQAARGLQSQAAVPLYDMALDTASNKRKETALRRNAVWLKEFVQENDTEGSSSVWAPIVLGMDVEEMAPGVEQQESDKLDGVAFVGQKQGVDLASQLKPHLEQTSLCNTVALLSTRSTLEIMDAARAGVNMIGTALPIKWAKSKRAFVVPISSSTDLRKRAKVSDDDKGETATKIELDEDGCIDMNDSKWALDALSLTPGCSCISCSNSHSRAYIHHLVQAKELLAEILLFAHNLHHLRELCRALSTDTDATYDSVKARI